MKNKKKSPPTQVKFVHKNIGEMPENELERVKLEMERIFQMAKDGIKNEYYPEIVMGKTLESKHLKTNQKPEEFTKQYLIKPLLSVLGYKENKDYNTETAIKTHTNDKIPDFTLIVDNEKILIEAKPLRVDLEKIGVPQLKDYLDKKTAVENYGIVTNGLEWRLIRYMEGKKRFDTINILSIEDAFYKLFGVKVENENQIINNFYSKLCKRNILYTFNKIYMKAGLEVPKPLNKFYN